jgi:transcriptional regulator with XRE-family HTH domain
VLDHRKTDGKTLGADLRSLRRSRGITLSVMARTLGRSVGWVSQIERDLSTPAIEDLRAIAATLCVPVSMLFGQSDTIETERGLVVRKGNRRPIGQKATGLIEELLSPDLTDDFEMVHSTFAPGSKLGVSVTRPTQEVAYMVSGKLDMTIAGREFTIGPGDSFRIRGEPYRWSNPYAEPALAIWVIAPPVY